MVSLFIGLLLVILGNKNSYCLSFGFIFMGVSLGFYSYYKTEVFNKDLSEINKEANKLEAIDEYAFSQLNKMKKKVQKQKIRFNILFCLAGVLLIVLGFCAL